MVFTEISNVLENSERGKISFMKIASIFKFIEIIKKFV